MNERCGRTAREWFRFTYGTQRMNSSGTDQLSYQNHYNKALNKCLARTLEVSPMKTPGTSVTEVVVTQRLNDVNENNDLGVIMYPHDQSDGGPWLCKIEQQDCSSVQEWADWAAAMMRQ